MEGCNNYNTTLLVTSALKFCPESFSVAGTLLSGRSDPEGANERDKGQYTFPG